MSEVTMKTAAQPWRTWVKNNDVLIFVLVTVISTITVILLPMPVLVAPMIVVFIPTLVSALLIRITEGKGQVRAQLFSRQKWQLNWKWILISAVVAAALQLGVMLAGVLALPGTPVKTGLFTLFHPFVLILAAGEEIGWRGFALPRLLNRGFSPLKAALVLGIPWGLMHVPLTLPGKLSYGIHPLAEFLLLITLSVLTTWVYLAAKENILMPTLLHGGQNMGAILSGWIPLGLVGWLMVLVYGAAAAAVILFSRGRLGRKEG